MKTPKFTPEAALAKAERYCAYQERCRSEVESRLMTWGVVGTEAAQIVDHLTREGFLDEERYARSFVRSKFRQNAWGRVRIGRELRQRRIDATLIGEALTEIDPEDYVEIIRHLYRRKLESLSPDDPQRRAKALHYLLQKGYEAEVVREAMR